MFSASQICPRIIKQKETSSADIIAVERIAVIKMPPSLSDLSDKSTLSGRGTVIGILSSAVDSFKLQFIECLDDIRINILGSNTETVSENSLVVSGVSFLRNSLLSPSISQATTTIYQ